MGFIFKNKEFRHHILLLTLLIVIFTLVTNFYITKVYEDIHHEWEEKNLAVVGVILEEKPELEEKLIPLFTKEPTKEEIQLGYDLAKRYGLSLSLEDINQSYMNEALVKVRVGGFLLLGLLFTFLLFFSFITLNHIYRQIRELSLDAEKIMRGDFNMIPLIQEEGDLPLLRFQFNQMADRLKNTLSRLGQEKLFLKALISDISHQLKTPLSSSLMFHDFLIDDPSIEERKDLLNRSKQQLEKINWLIKELLNISKLESGVIQFDRRESKINSTVEEVITSLQQKIDSKNISLYFDDFEHPIYLNHDERWLGEAIRNIVNNAIDYSNTYGEIRIKLESDAYFVRILIKDKGIGISPVDLPHVFERFYQARKGRPNIEGTGIGLALTKLIVDKHGGRIGVESDGINKGTTFIMTFPK